MTAFFRDWLLGIVAAALAVALAQALTPEGAVKKVGRLLGGLILLLAVTRPLLRGEPGEWDLPENRSWEEMAAAVEAQTEENRNLLEELIAGQAETYIEETNRGAEEGEIGEYEAAGVGP